MEEVNEKNYSYYSPVKNDVTYRDPYIEEMRMKLRQMRSERKEAEKETKQMHIKLTTLKNENKANWSEIEKTKIKTNKKMNLLDQFVKAKEQKQKLKEERDYWKEQYVNVDNLNKLLSEDPFNEEPKGNTPIENRKAQGKMTGQWTSYDKVENFDIFS